MSALAGNSRDCQCGWLRQPDLVAGPGLFIGAANAIGQCDWGEPMLKFEYPNKGPRRLLAGGEQDLGEGLRIELDWLVSLLHPG